MKGNSKSRGVLQRERHVMPCYVKKKHTAGIFSWLETACYESFSRKKQHVMGIIGRRINMF